VTDDNLFSVESQQVQCILGGTCTEEHQFLSRFDLLITTIHMKQATQSEYHTSSIMMVLQGKVVAAGTGRKSQV
jgi:hypothetical protein